MPKKLVFMFVCASVGLAACIGEPSTSPLKNDVTQIESAMPTIYKGLSIEIESFLVENVLTVKTVIENTSEETIPLHYEKGRFLRVSLSMDDEQGQETVLDITQKKLKAKEQLAFETSYLLEHVDGNYTINAQLLLQPDEAYGYVEKELNAVEVVRKEKEQELVFLPKEKMSYTYETKRNEEWVQRKETFVHFDKGFAQSVDTEWGTKIYYVDQKGLYVAYQNETSQENNLIGQVAYEKKLLLGFPIKIGTNWEVDGVHYEITALEQEVDTPFATIDNVVEVTSDFGTGMQYFYQKDIGLVQVRVKNGDKWEVITQLINKKGK